MRVLVLVGLLLLADCTFIRQVIDPSPVSTVIIEAKVRRAQVIAEIARINHVLARVAIAENRIVLEAQLNDRRVELERLNRIIEGD